MGEIERSQLLNPVQIPFINKRMKHLDLPAVLTDSINSFNKLKILPDLSKVKKFGLFYPKKKPAIFHIKKGELKNKNNYLTPNGRLMQPRWVVSKKLIPMKKDQKFKIKNYKYKKIPVIGINKKKLLLGETQLKDIYHFISNQVELKILTQTQIKNEENFGIDYQKFWSILKKINPINKINNLIFKMHNNLITPNYKSSTCVMCGGVDSSLHATVLCPNLNQNKLLIIKILKKITNQELTINNNNLINLNHSAPYKKVKEIFSIFLIWINWNSRNKFFFEKETLKEEEFISILKQIIVETHLKLRMKLKDAVSFIYYTFSAVYDEGLR